MNKKEKIRLFKDTFPEVVDALELYANSEGYVGILKYINKEVEQIIDFVEKNLIP